MPRNLLERCSKFEKLAGELSVSRVSLEENRDPILKEMSDLKDFDDRVALAKKHYKQLGIGSSRTIFQMDKKMVLKVAHNDKGIAQNQAEMSPKMQRPCTNHVLVADAKGKWIIIRFTETVSKESFKKMTGLGFDSFMNALFYKFNNDSDKWSRPKNYEEIKKHPLFKCMVELTADCDLQIGDIDKPSSWGELDGRPVLRDYGLTREVWDKFYDDDSESKSTTSSKTS
jgi:hypothetical protein